jgi:hypothetical protein
MDERPSQSVLDPFYGPAHGLAACQVSANGSAARVSERTRREMRGGKNVF